MNKEKIVKLVRDKIPEIATGNGLTFRECKSDEEYHKFLEEKLIEECQEYLISREVDELSDIYEVLITIAKFRDVTLERLEVMRKSKEDMRGPFNKRIILEKTMQNQ